MTSVNTSPIGKWLRCFAIISVLVLPIAVIGYRLNFYGFSVASKILAASLLISAVTFLVSSVINLIKRDEISDTAAKHAWLICLVPLVFLGSQIFVAKSLPMIHNISTDVIDPPQFEKVIELRGENSNPHEYDASTHAEVQQAAYPDIKTLTVDDNADLAYRKSMATAVILGWEIVNKDSSNRLVEATETTLLWKFKDDVVIRISANGDDQSNVDLRSVSRVGRSDLGANAKRIQSFFDTYKSLLLDSQ